MKSGCAYDSDKGEQNVPISSGFLSIPLFMDIKYFLKDSRQLSEEMLQLSEEVSQLSETVSDLSDSSKEMSQLSEEVRKLSEEEEANSQQLQQLVESNAADQSDFQRELNGFGAALQEVSDHLDDVAAVVREHWAISNQNMSVLWQEDPLGEHF